MNTDTENRTDAEQIAKQILILSRNTLLVNLRFLDMALSMFKYVSQDKVPLATDGSRFAYDPKAVLKSYLAEKEQPVRDYLHMVFHCVYRHMFVNPAIDRRVWDLSCDAAVENIISELRLGCTASSKEAGEAGELAKLRGELNMLTAEKIYHYYISKNMAPERIEKLAAIFRADDHDVWYMTRETAEKTMGISGSSGSESQNENRSSSSGSEGGAPSVTMQFTAEAENGGGSSDDSSQTQENGGNSSDGSSQTQENGGASTQNSTSLSVSMSRSELEKMWKDISERMQTDILMFSNGRYGDAGSIVQNLKEVNREKYDYGEFLKKFAVMGEAMKINDDEFDYIFYTYGMKLFGNMPLIEPLEYKEVKRIKDFVIAIDTSGSVIGDLVQTFVQKTYNVMKSTESFFSKINLHIIQCDEQIQEDVVITSQEEFDRYMKTMELHGFGGNNEVRLFKYVDELIAKKQFTNLKGMIYFTDGYGIFPQEKPNYEVAFVFVNDRYEIPEVPPWVIKLVLQKDDIKNDM